MIKTMRGHREYQGGYYAILEYIGLYVRFFIFKLFRQNKSLAYLSGEENYPKIKTKQRFFCISVGLFSSILTIMLLIFFVYVYIDF